jgi:hypothetical protein
MKTTLPPIIELLSPVSNSLFHLVAIPFKQSFFRAKLLLLFIALGTFPLLAQDAQNTVRVISDKQTQEIISKFTLLENSIEIFKDEKGNTTFEEVAANDWLFSENNTRGNFEADKVYWMKLNLLAGEHYN